MTTNPTAKRVKVEFSSQEQVFNHIIQQIIVIHNSFNDKVKQLESKIDGFVTTIKEALSEHLPGEKKQHHCCEEVLERISGIEQFIQSIFVERRNQNVYEGSTDVPVVLLPNYKPPSNLSSAEGDSTIQVITLNSESDYPNGSWLGNEKNPEARVRVPITPSQLLHINTLCTTPEKMAIVLLDHLFSQEVQATSNLSGKGKHFKKQLDPLKIYGIKAHLMHKFNITERDWYRIKQNLDSKCRTAWRKKAMGLPLSRNKTNREDPTEKMLRSNSIVLKELSFISEDNSQELSSMIVEDTDCLTLSGGCCEQTLTIITDAGDTVNVPILSAEDDLSDEHSSADDMLSLRS